MCVCMLVDVRSYRGRPSSVFYHSCYLLNIRCLWPLECLLFLLSVDFRFDLCWAISLGQTHCPAQALVHTTCKNRCSCAA